MQMWLLTVGEYSEETVLGVVRGSFADARRIASGMTAERLLARQPSDLTYVAVQPTEDLTSAEGPRGRAVV